MGNDRESTPKKQRPDIQQELRASEERYQAFIGNSNEGIWRFELDKPMDTDAPVTRQVKHLFKYAFLAEANEAMAKMYGLESSDEIIGARLDELMDTDDPKNTEYLTAFIKSGYSLSGAESHEKDLRSGEDKYFLNSLVGIIENSKLVRAWGTQTDVTKQHRANTALRQSEDRLALALQASNMGTWEWNIKTGELIWSGELKKLFGLKTDDDISYERYLKLLHPDDAQTMKKHIEKSIKTGKQYMAEHRTIWPDGSVHWLLGQGKAVLENGKAVRMVGTSMNIDKRKLFEIELHESEQRFRNMADAAPILIWVAGPDKMLTYFNKPWRDFTGRKAGEDLGNGWQNVIHPEDLEYITKEYFTAFDERKPYRAEYRIRRHDGKYFWMLDKGSPRYSPEGEFLGYVGSMIEVDELKSTRKRQQELEEINHKLELQREQLMELNNSKDEFISVASHQLRTPATGVKQYIGMLLEGYGGELNERQIKMLRTAYESNERELRIIDDLLRIAHVDAGKVTLIKTTTNLVDLIEEIIDEQADKFKQKRQGISFAHKGRQITARVDPERMRMVLENIIDNASKYSPEGKNIAVELMKSRKHVTITVMDQGVGIAKRDLPRLFQKFSRVDNILSTLVGGTGLGLYWVKKIVTLHDGTITVESKPHKGSTFVITIPHDSHEKNF